ncbi:hypothetical protein [Novispirillum itersonii]|uniref:hypothetical protein n=1 Tax=Novispirillum itersonii TaxID=189 RepID=UPI0003780906|nr:hypothetical protein [Novispirillum itersonii]
MYTDDDLDAAVGAGVLDGRAVAAFRTFVAARQDGRMADEEHFRLLTGFNDIFVSVAITLVLAALYGLGTALLAGAGAALMAVAAWGLAEYFTRRRRMALPSILLLLAFTGGLYASVTMAGFMLPGLEDSGRWAALPLLGGAVLAGAGAALHWWRFRVPVTVAAGTAAGAAALLGLLLTLAPDVAPYLAWVILPAGVGVFVLAMRWDASDRERATRRADVAFWLHLLAAGMIVHPVFALLPDLPSPLAGALLVLAVYAVLMVVALITDRRAILVSSLAYVLYAVISAVTQSAAQMGAEIGWALVALPVGSVLLLFSAFWHRARRALLPTLPQRLRDMVPVAV